MPVPIYDLAQGALSWALFYERVERDQFKHLIRDHWHTEAESYEGSLEVLHEDLRHGSDEVILVAEDGTVARASIEGGEVNVTAAAADRSQARDLIELLRKQIVPTPLDEDGRRPVSFWTWSPYGPQQNTRRIQVPTWIDVDGNYGKINDDLAEMMNFQPTSAGQLLLWRGPPGTGKTWALRALIWEWRDWADFHYIVDPDKFFGEHASYLTSVLFHEEPAVYVADDLNHPSKSENPQGRWKILILEDCGEMLSKDARERSGQGLSRLLNLVDGLIGQGLRVLVLVTTNEEIGSLHEAIARPGRCACNLEFVPFIEPDIGGWLETRGLYRLPDLPTRATLAELYAIANGGEVRSGSLVGFTG